MSIHIKKILSTLLAVTMLLCTFSLGETVFPDANAASSVQSSLDSVISSYPAGTRWTGSFDGGIQCYGFAKLVIYKLFGAYSSSRYRSWTYAGESTSGMNAIGSITSYSATNVKNLLSKAKCGDVLQFNTTKQHSMIVYSVDSSGVTVYDCNWDNNCGIRKAHVSFGAWSGRNSSKLTLLRSANYPSDVVHTVDSSYGTNFTSYPKAKITASNIFDANHNQISSTCWIGTSDKCTIHEVYTDGCCKVTYPLDSGGSKTVYSKISLFNTHTHSYTGARVYESAHPHRISQRCTEYSSCGGFIWLDEYHYCSDCSQCQSDFGARIKASVSSVSLDLNGSNTKTITVTVYGNVPSSYGARYTIANGSILDANWTKIWDGNSTSLTVTGESCGSTNLTLSVYETTSGNQNTLHEIVIPVTVTCSHTYNSGTVTTAPTCSKTGVKKYTCTVCKATKTETIAKNSSNHTGGTAIKNAKSATCSSEGYTGDKYCSGCGAKLSTGQTIAKTAHSYDSGKITTAATCKSTGVKTYTCTVCKATKTETIAKSSSNHAGGTTLKNVKSSTCSSEGYTGDKYCSGCGAKLSSGQTIAKTAHSYNSGTITTAAACTTAGVKTYTCTVCKTTKTETIAALGHNFAGASRTNSDGSISYKCTRCNVYGNTASLTKIAIESIPSKTVYNVGESLSTSGLKLRLTYSDASYKIVASGFTTSGFDSSTGGTKTVTVTYGNKTTSFTVTVNSAAVDESSAQITVDSAKTTVGQTVQLCVKLKNNPGIAGLAVSLDYDKNALTLTNTSNGSLFDGFTSAINLIWDSANNVTADGTLATFTFKVNENAAKGDYSVNIIVRSCINENGNDVKLNAVNGKISVIDFEYGDANGDGNISMKDVVLLRQYLADFDYDTNTSSVTVKPGADANGDSKIDMKDVVILRQYIANYDYNTDTSTVVLGPQ